MARQASRGLRAGSVMTVQISSGPRRTPLLPRPSPNRTIPFNAHVQRVAPDIRELQAEGVQGIDDLAAAMNERGVPSPSGTAWSYGTMRRVLLRGRKLRLCSGPRTPATAANSRRPSSPRVHRQRSRTRPVNDGELALLAEVDRTQLQ